MCVMNSHPQMFTLQPVRSLRRRDKHRNPKRSRICIREKGLRPLSTDGRESKAVLQLVSRYSRACWTRTVCNRAVEFSISSDKIASEVYIGRLGIFWTIDWDFLRS